MREWKAIYLVWTMLYQTNRLIYIYIPGIIISVFLSFFEVKRVTGGSMIAHTLDYTAEVITGRVLAYALPRYTLCQKVF